MTRLLHIATIANDLSQYQRMRASMAAVGFSDETCRFTLCDNSKSNQFEPFGVLRSLKSDGNEPFILLCHQDLIFDESSSFAVLQSQLALLNEGFPTWALAGTAGMDRRGFPAACMNDPHGSHRSEHLPRQAISLDENFLLLRRDRFILPSPAMSGFHFYGTDLVLRAMQNQYRAYVIEMPVMHLSAGQPHSDAYTTARQEMIAIWRPQLLVGLVQSMPSQFRVSRWGWLELILQYRISASVLRRLRLPIIFAQGKGGQPG